MIKILVNSFMAITLVLSLPLNAQPQKPLKPKNVQMAMINATLSEIQMALSLTEEQMEILRPAYIHYQKRVTRLNADNNRQFNRVRVDTLTDEQAEEYFAELQEYLKKQQTGELSDDELDDVNGGKCKISCPNVDPGGWCTAGWV